MKKAIGILGFLCITTVGFSQLWMTKTGSVSFYSHTSVEDIRANNNEAISFLDASKGEFRFQVLIKGFKFPKAAMQEHFNGEQYMNSDEFPKAEFKGTMDQGGSLPLKTDGEYKVVVNGEMTMHGVTKTISVPGIIKVKNGFPEVNAVFQVNRSDFKISVPSFSAAKIAESIEVTVYCKYEAFKSGNN